MYKAMDSNDEIDGWMREIVLQLGKTSLDAVQLLSQLASILGGGVDS
jgi:hypothetical protein